MSSGGRKKPMQAYICVYRHGVPGDRDWRRTQTASATDQLLAHFLRTYHEPGNYFDWGDDPSFFAAQHLLGNPTLASWGVCRRNVREKLDTGDFVLWFCGRQDRNNKKIWHYYFIGCATVAKKITRFELWEQPEYLRYRQFYNVLARPLEGMLTQHETFHSYHDDWEARAAAPYILFDADENLSALNLLNPIHVATKPADSPTECWLSGVSQRVKEIEAAIFLDLGITRRLRTKNPYIAHAPVALHNWPRSSEERLKSVRETLISLVR